MKYLCTMLHHLLVECSHQVAKCTFPWLCRIPAEPVHNRLTLGCIWRSAVLLVYSVDNVVRISSSKHPKRLDREGKLIIWIHNHRALIKDAFDSVFLLPFSVRLLAVHDQLDAALDGCWVRIFGVHQAD